MIKQKIRNLVKMIIRPFSSVLYEEMEKVKLEREDQRKQLIKKNLQSCGLGVQFNGNIIITDPRMVNIGNNVHIGDNARFSTAAGLCIGDNTHISRNVTIYTQNHNYRGDSLPYDNTGIPKPVAIGRNVWIGMNVSIIPGVRIGDGAIIGMGTVVTNDIPEHAIVGSSSENILKYRDKQHYADLVTQNRFGGINGVILSNDQINEFKFGINNIEIFFVVTTGRSGSTTIANALSKHKDIICLHEPRPQLIRLSTALAHKEKDLSSIEAELFDIYCNSSTYPSKVYGESDQKNWNLIAILARLIPNSKFVWLLRDGRDMVSSTFS